MVQDEPMYTLPVFFRNGLKDYFFSVLRLQNKTINYAFPKSIVGCISIIKRPKIELNTTIDN